MTNQQRGADGAGTKTAGAEWPDSSPNPTPEELASPQFGAIWQVIKSWDIGIPEEYGGYCGATGSHVVRILRALSAVTPAQPAATPGVPDSLRALSEAGRDAVSELEWLRGQVIGLCEHTEDKAGAELEKPGLTDHERGFHKGAYTEAKGIRRAIAEAVRCRLKDLEGDAPALASPRADGGMTAGDLSLVLAQLRHAYTHLHAERVREQREFADGLIAPQIRRLEALVATPAQPAGAVPDSLRALVEVLAAWIGTRQPITQWQADAQAKALVAGPLAPLLADLQRVTAEYDRGLDHRDDLMDRVVSLKTSVAAAEARAARLQAEVEAKDRALTEIAEMTEMGLAPYSTDLGTQAFEWRMRPTRAAGIARLALAAREAQAKKE